MSTSTQQVDRPQRFTRFLLRISQMPKHSLRSVSLPSATSTWQVHLEASYSRSRILDADGIHRLRDRDILEAYPDGLVPTAAARGAMGRETRPPGSARPVLRGHGHAGRY